MTVAPGPRGSAGCLQACGASLLFLRRPFDAMTSRTLWARLRLPTFMPRQASSYCCTVGLAYASSRSRSSM